MRTTSGTRWGAAPPAAAGAGRAAGRRPPATARTRRARRRRSGLVRAPGRRPAGAAARCRAPGTGRARPAPGTGRGPARCCPRHRSGGCTCCRRRCPAGRSETQGRDGAASALQRGYGGCPHPEHHRLARVRLGRRGEVVDERGARWPWPRGTWVGEVRLPVGPVPSLARFAASHRRRQPRGRSTAARRWPGPRPSRCPAHEDPGPHEAAVHDRDVADPTEQGGLVVGLGHGLVEPREGQVAAALAADPRLGFLPERDVEHADHDPMAGSGVRGVRLTSAANSVPSLRRPLRSRCASNARGVGRAEILVPQRDVASARPGARGPRSAGPAAPRR